MREVTKSFDEVVDVLVSVFGDLEFEEEKLLNVSELSLFLNKVFKDELVLLKTHVDEINCL